MPFAESDSAPPMTIPHNVLWRIFAAAVAIRWLYSLTLLMTMGREGLMGADSHGYLAQAEHLAANALQGSLHNWDWLGSDLGVMPMMPWLLGLHVALFGQLAPLTYVLLQGLLDAGVCLLIYGIAGALDRRFALPTAIAATVNPTQIVLSGLVYTDVPFVFFVALFLYGSVRWLRAPSWSWAILIGTGLGGAALVRIMIVPWVPVLAVFLLGLLLIRRKLLFRHVAQVAAAVAIFCVCIGPVLARNVIQYGSWSLTSQGGGHLALWVVPLVREAKEHTPWAQGAADVDKLYQARFGSAANNPFENSRRYAEIGREELRKLGLPAVIKAWTVGAVINLASPAIILSPPIAQLPRMGFYATPGQSTMDKIASLLFRSDNALYAWMLLAGIAGVAVVRLIQLLGAVTILRLGGDWSIAALLVLWAGFVLAVNGPIASPKYRLPIEPVLMVLAGAGIARFCSRWNTRPSQASR